MAWPQPQASSHHQGIEQGKEALAAATFAMLLCLKHIYLYYAPVFGCYFIGRYLCRSNGLCSPSFFSNARASLTRLFALFSLWLLPLLVALQGSRCSKGCGAWPPPLAFVC